MARIDLYPSVSTLQGGTLFLAYDASNSDTRKTSLTSLQAYMQANLDFTSGALTPQYSAPAATGFSVQVTDSSANTWLVLTPLAGYAAGTLVLPAVTNAVIGQEILVNCTQAVTTLTIDGNGATVVGAPTTLAANDYFRLKYESVLKTWYRVG